MELCEYWVQNCLRVFDGTSETGHVTGQNNNGTLYFINCVLYSYGSHYPLAFFSTTKNQFFVNFDRYSTTTSKHRSQMYSALPQNYINHSEHFTTEQMQAGIENPYYWN